MSNKRISKTSSFKKKKKSPTQTISVKKPIFTIHNKITSKSGWISPEGVYYECTSWNHDDVGQYLGGKFYNDPRSITLENEGWIRFSKGDVLVVIDRDKFGRKKPFTNKHIDMFYDYMIENNLNLISFLIMEKINGAISRNWEAIERKDLYEKKW